MKRIDPTAPMFFKGNFLGQQLINRRRPLYSRTYMFFDFLRGAAFPIWRDIETSIPYMGCGQKNQNLIMKRIVGSPKLFTRDVLTQFLSTRVVGGVDYVYVRHHGIYTHSDFLHEGMYPIWRNTTNDMNIIDKLREL